MHVNNDSVINIKTTRMLLSINKHILTTSNVGLLLLLVPMKLYNTGNAFPLTIVLLHLSDTLVINSIIIMKSNYCYQVTILLFTVY